MNEVAPCILCSTPTRSRGVLIPSPKDWQTLAELGAIVGDALVVPLCIRHRVSARLTDRVAAAVIAKTRKGVHCAAGQTPQGGAVRLPVRSMFGIAEGALCARRLRRTEPDSGSVAVCQSGKIRRCAQSRESL